MASVALDKGCVRFEINAKKLNILFWKKAKSYRHFKNIYLILREALYKNQLEGEKHKEPPFKLDSNIDATALYKAFIKPDVIRAVSKKRKGGKIADQVDLVNSALCEVELFQNLVETAEDLQAKTIHKEIKKLQAAFKSFYTKIKNGDKDARPPKPKKLSKIYEQTVAIDQDCLSFKRKNIVKVNINGGMVSLPLRHDTVLKVVKDFSKVQSAEIICSESRLTLILLYNRETIQTEETISISKDAGLDLGVNNTAAIAIDDDTSPSILFSGAKFVKFNSTNNRLLAKYKSQKDILLNIDQEKRDNAFYGQLNDLSKKITKLYAKRRKFFFDQFHKLSTRILEDLQEQGVTRLFVSRNLSDCKNTKGNSMGKTNNQKFHQIPILRLLDNISYKTGAYGIEVVEIDEAYTSKCSCLSGNIMEAQRLRKDEEEELISNEEAKQLRTKVLNGRRVRRSLFKDTVYKLSFHADINAAFNHIRVGRKATQDSLNHLLDKVWKLANPIKIDLRTNALNCYLDRPLMEPC